MRLGHSYNSRLCDALAELVARLQVLRAKHAGTTGSGHSAPAWSGWWLWNKNKKHIQTVWPSYSHCIKSKWSDHMSCTLKVVHHDERCMYSKFQAYSNIVLCSEVPLL